MKKDDIDAAIRNALTAAAIVAHERRAIARKGKNKDAIHAADGMCQHIDVALAALGALERCEPIAFISFAELMRGEV